MTNARLEGYHPQDVINVTETKTFREINASLFEKSKSRDVESGLRRSWKKLFYDPARQSAFSTMENLAAAIHKQ